MHEASSLMLCAGLIGVPGDASRDMFASARRNEALAAYNPKEDAGLMSLARLQRELACARASGEPYGFDDCAREVAGDAMGGW